MDKATDELVDHDHDEADETTDESGWEQFPSATIEAVPVTETTAGVHVTRYDVDKDWDDMPLVVGLEQHYPPEDEQEGGAVFVHGEREALQLIQALSELLADRFEAAPIEDDSLYDGGDGA